MYIHFCAESFTKKSAWWTTISALGWMQKLLSSFKTNVKSIQKSAGKLFFHTSLWCISSQILYIYFDFFFVEVAFCSLLKFCQLLNFFQLLVCYNLCVKLNCRKKTLFSPVCHNVRFVMWCHISNVFLARGHSVNGSLLSYSSPSVFTFSFCFLPFSLPIFVSSLSHCSVLLIIVYWKILVNIYDRPFSHLWTEVGQKIWCGMECLVARKWSTRHLKTWISASYLNVMGSAFHYLVYEALSSWTFLGLLEGPPPPHICQ